MKTIEERASNTWADVNDPDKSGEEREVIILHALRDQIEDCAKEADILANEAQKQSKHYRSKSTTQIGMLMMADGAKYIAQAIRALASPTQEKGD